MGDFLTALYFWVVYEIFSWPMRLALQPVPMAPDLRRVLSRVTGPLLICFASWIAARVVIPLHWTTIWLWFFAALGAARWSCRRLGHTPDWRAMVRLISDRRHQRREWIIEGIGFFVFLAFLYFRRQAPEMTTAQLNAGIAAEKFDNAMVFWSSFHAVWTPPDDYWMSGYSQAYYYFGHFFWAWIGRAALLPGEWVITLAMTRLVLLVWEGCYLLVRAFGIRPLSAAIGAFFIAWGGNPRAVSRLYDHYKYYTGYEARAEEERGFPFAAEYRQKVLDNPKDFLRGYAWWDPSRALNGYQDGITEFLAWTAILGDFHAHHLSIPWMMAMMAVVLAGDRWFKLRKKHVLPVKSPRKGKRRDGEGDQEKSATGALTTESRRILLYRGLGWILCLIPLGVASTISNLWVAPLVGLATLGILAWHDGWGARGLGVRLLLVPAMAVSMLAGVYLSRGTLATPIESLNREAGEHRGLLERIAEKSPIKKLPETVRSTPAMLARLWGFQVGILAVAFVAAISRRAGEFARKHPILAGGCITAFLVCIGLNRFVFPNEPAFLWMGFAALMACLAWSRRPGFRPLNTAFVVGCVVLLASFEVFYFADAISSSWPRYNSYFKFMFPIWPVLGAASWACVHRLWFWTGFPAVKWGLRVAGVFLIPFVMVMSVAGFPARTLSAHATDVSPRQPTLNAVDWIEHLPEWQHEGRMLRWIRENIPPGTRIAESIDPKHGAYGFQGRVASLAGRPVPMGWTHHEHQWRGFDNKQIPERAAKVEALYNSTTKEQVLAAAQELEVEWVVLGKIEREALGATKAERFYQAVAQAQVEWHGFPENKPEVFLFRLPRP